MDTGNRGEWSELYAFLQVVGEGKLYAADENLNKISGIYATVIKAIREGIDYKRDFGDVTIANGSATLTVPIFDFLSNARTLFNVISSARGRSFGVPQLTTFFNNIGVTKIKASSAVKGDIVLLIHDSFSGLEHEIGYSIKSFIGGKPTLFNASNASVIYYDLVPTISIADAATINGISGQGKIIKRIQEIKKRGAGFAFSGISNSIFEKNLKMIDYRMPELLADLFLESYSVRGKRIPDVIDQYLLNNPHEDRELIEYKMKNVLVAFALGMVPATPWNGLDEANGGYIVVKDNGELVCYHIYDRNNLKQYLFNHTQFDTPSSGRTGLGEIHNNAVGTTQFCLTLQIRFC